MKHDALSAPVKPGPIQGPCALYRHFDKDGNLLYVGISVNLFARIGEHRKSSEWFDEIAVITLEKYPTRQSALYAEREAIQAENPIYNQSHALRHDTRDATWLDRWKTGASSVPKIPIEPPSPEATKAPTPPKITPKPDASDGPARDRLLSSKQVCAVLGVSAVTLSRWRSSQTGPEYIRLSKTSVRYREADISKWAAAQVERFPEQKKNIW